MEKVTVSKTIFNLIDETIQKDEKVQHKLVAKVFAYFFYFLTIILPIVDACIKRAHSCSQKTTRKTVTVKAKGAPFTEECKTQLKKAFTDAYDKIKQAADNKQFVKITRATKFNLENPERFKIQFEICKELNFSQYENLDIGGFKDKRERLNVTEWFPFVSNTTNKTNLLIPPTVDTAASNIATYVLKFGEEGWNKLADAAINEMERLLMKKKATQLTFCTDGVVVNWLHLRFESIK